MTIQLSSLRVAADFDPTSYKRGMDQKVAADKAGAESSKAIGVALAQADAAMDKTSNGSVRLSRALVDGYANAAKFESTMRSLGRSVERGMDLDRASVLLDAAYKKYGLVADAMTLVQQGHVGLAPLVSSLNQRLEVQALVAERAASAQNKLAVAQSAQLAFNRRLGVTDGITSDTRGSDIAAYGRELDNLRAKYNPLFAVIQQYRTAQADIRQAHSVGALSVDEMTSALQRERKAALENIAALKQRGAASGGARSFQTANIAAQFQDIAVTSAMGMSPIQIALQQGTQLSAVFNEMGRGRDVIAGIGQAFMSIVSPVSLVTIGTIAAGAALLQYVASSNQVKTIDEILAAHEQNIKRLGPAYEEAIEKQKKYTVESPLVVNIDLKEDQRQAIERRAKEARVAMDRIIAGTWQDVGGDQPVMSRVFQPAERAISQFISSVRAGEPQVTRFREEIGKLSASGQLTSEAAKSLIEYSKSAYEAETKLDNVSGVVDRYAASLQNVETTLNRLQPNRANRELQGLWDKFRDGELSAQRLLTAINNLSFASPDLREARGEILRLVEAMQLAKETATGFANTTSKSDLGYDPSQPNRPLSDLNFNSRFGAENDAISKLQTQKRELERQPRKSAAERQAERDANAYRDLVKSAQDRIDQLGLEEQLVGKTGVAADTYRMKLELIQKAQDKGRTLSDEHRQELERLAASYGKVAERVAALTLSEELRFERDQLFRSSTEQRVASTLRSSGIDPVSSQGQLLAGQIRLNEQLAENRDMALSFGQSLVSAFDDGKITIEELGKAGLSVLDRLVDKMLNDVINAIMQVGQAGAGIGGGGGGLFGFLGGLFSGGGSSFFPSAPGVGLYANGGVFPNRLSSFSGNFTNQIVSKPTMFAFAKGVGLMGEAGEEAIMPLARGSDGSLGVRTYGRSSGSEAGGSSSDGRTVIAVELSPDLVGSILEQSGKQAVSIVQQNDENHQNRRQNGDSW
ncbi:phage tail length tape measure family protein [Ochrobactrum soli]|uniref:Putative tail length tape measure protein n=1 Tax=Ochrobactrum soli TaxID=2448455 RepID=A0A2P9HHI9_9HYPH|nr:phage tail length tape measure family protein [[Ochrobactrum] soli]SPL63582.1 putative tail length tape measure protein precursor [[Ochrobactrum] soli]